jgi:hypothetical protein
MTSETYDTSDLNLAAFLLASGFALGSVEGPPGRRLFRFPEAARDHAPAYYQNAPVPSRAFANALRDLKALVRQSS